jgi:hypothetical protein
MHRWKQYMRTKLLGTVELPDDISTQLNIITHHHQEFCVARSLRMIPQIPVSVFALWSSWLVIPLGSDRMPVLECSVITFLPRSRSTLHSVCSDVCRQWKIHKSYSRNMDTPYYLRIDVFWVNSCNWKIFTNNMKIACSQCVCTEMSSLKATNQIIKKYHRTTLIPSSMWW